MNPNLEILFYVYCAIVIGILVLFGYIGYKQCRTEKTLIKSDVVSLTLIRKNPQGRLIRFSLSGEDAVQWGWLMSNCSKFRNCQPKDGKTWKELNWQREFVNET